VTAGPRISRVSREEAEIAVGSLLGIPPAEIAGFTVLAVQRGSSEVKLSSGMQQEHVIALLIRTLELLTGIEFDRWGDQP
jgi:hypothetical protein